MGKNKKKKGLFEIRLILDLGIQENVEGNVKRTHVFV